MTSASAAGGTSVVANRGAITACVILAVIMQALDTTIANVALPYIQGSVPASADQINWVLTSYIVAAAVMTPPSGYLANRFGRKRILLVAITGFVVASVLCGFAQSLPQIVGFMSLAPSKRMTRSMGSWLCRRVGRMRAPLRSAPATWSSKDVVRPFSPSATTYAFAPSAACITLGHRSSSA